MNSSPERRCWPSWARRGEREGARDQSSRSTLGLVASTSAISSSRGPDDAFDVEYGHRLQCTPGRSRAESRRRRSTRCRERTMPSVSVSDRRLERKARKLARLAPDAGSSSARAARRRAAADVAAAPRRRAVARARAARRAAPGTRSDSSRLRSAPPVAEPELARRSPAPPGVQRGLAARHSVGEPLAQLLVARRACRRCGGRRAAARRCRSSGSPGAGTRRRSGRRGGSGRAAAPRPKAIAVPASRPRCRDAEAQVLALADRVEARRARSRRRAA